MLSTIEKFQCIIPHTRPATAALQRYWEAWEALELYWLGTSDCQTFCAVCHVASAFTLIQASWRDSGSVTHNMQMHFSRKVCARNAACVAEHPWHYHNNKWCRSRVSSWFTWLLQDMVLMPWKLKMHRATTDQCCKLRKWSKEAGTKCSYHKDATYTYMHPVFTARPYLCQAKLDHCSATCAGGVLTLTNTYSSVIKFCGKSICRHVLLTDRLLCICSV